LNCIFLTLLFERVKKLENNIKVISNRIHSIEKGWEDVKIYLEIEDEILSKVDKIIKKYQEVI